MSLKIVLSKLGLKDKRAEIYLACLESRGLTAYAIAKKAGLKRPTAYDIIESLVKDNLVYTSFKRGSKCYYPADPTVLSKKMRDQERELTEIMPLLNTIYNRPNAKRPTIKYFNGIEGIKEMYNDSLSSLKKGDEILLYCGQDILKYLPKYAEQYVKERVKKGITVRGIYRKTSELEKYMAKNNDQLRTVRIVDSPLFPFTGELDIYKNKVAIANYGKEFFGILIESDEFFKSQKAIFELAWLGANTVT